MQKLKPFLRELYEQGLSLRERIKIFLDSWPKDEKHEASFGELPSELRSEANVLIIDVRRWFNSVKIQVLPYLLYNEQFLYYLLRQVEAAIKKMRYKRPYPQNSPTSIQMILNHNSGKSDIETFSNLEYAKEEAREAMDTALSLIESVPSETIIAPASSQPEVRFTPNSAFILMWMDPAHPELDDVCNAIKEVCSNYGIHAVKADDIEHEDKITDIVLQYIEKSEFLIADLTGERLNVYYEVGFAHALGKRPILYRKAGTKLHFDLSVHNVKEYKNLTDLKTQLSRRLEAILGRSLDDNV